MITENGYTFQHWKPGKIGKAKLSYEYTGRQKNKFFVILYIQCDFYFQLLRVLKISLYDCILVLSNIYQFRKLNTTLKWSFKNTTIALDAAHRQKVDIFNQSISLTLYIVHKK